MSAIKALGKMEVGRYSFNVFGIPDVCELCSHDFESIGQSRFHVSNVVGETV